MAFDPGGTQGNGSSPSNSAGSPLAGKKSWSIADIDKLLAETSKPGDQPEPAAAGPARDETGGAFAPASDAYTSASVHPVPDAVPDFVSIFDTYTSTSVDPVPNDAPDEQAATPSASGPASEQYSSAFVSIFDTYTAASVDPVPDGIPAGEDPGNPTAVPADLAQSFDPPASSGEQPSFELTIEAIDAMLREFDIPEPFGAPYKPAEVPASGGDAPPADETPEHQTAVLPDEKDALPGDDTSAPQAADLSGEEYVPAHYASLEDESAVSFGSEDASPLFVITPPSHEDNAGSEAADAAQPPESAGEENDIHAIQPQRADATPFDRYPSVSLPGYPSVDITEEKLRKMTLTARIRAFSAVREEDMEGGAGEDESHAAPQAPPAPEQEPPVPEQDSPAPEQQPPAYGQEPAKIRRISLTADYSGGMESDDLRRRFMGAGKIERTFGGDTADSGGPIEKPGVIVKKAGPPATGDLMPMPKVIPAEEMLHTIAAEREKTRIAARTQPPPAADESPEDIEGQIVLEGFEPRSPASETVPEELVEKQLVEKRREKAKKFNLVGVPEAPADAAAPPPLDLPDGEPEQANQQRKTEKRRLEYRFPEQRNRIASLLNSSRQKATARLAGLLYIQLLALLLLALPELLDRWFGIQSTLLTQGSRGYFALNFLLLLLASAFNAPTLVSGFSSLVRGKPNIDSLPSLAVAICALHTVAGFSLFPGRGAEVYCAAAVFALIPAAYARRAAAIANAGNFRLCAFEIPDSLHGLQDIDDDNDSFEAGKSILMDKPEILYAGAMNFPSGFFEHAKANEGISAGINRVFVPFIAAASFAAAVAAGIMAKSAQTAFAVFSGALCAGAPVFASAYLMSAVARANRKLNPDAVMVAGRRAAAQYSGCDAVVIDSAGLFDPYRCEMFGVKDYKNVRIDDILLYSAAVVIKAGGPLAEAFTKVIGGTKNILPPVKNLHYEDRLGLTGLIYNQTVLFGNRQLLGNHNVEVPVKAEEDRYLIDGRKVVYLAVENKLAAMFVIGYAPDTRIAPYIKTLQKQGVKLLVRTWDSNITEELITDFFALKAGSVKILSAGAGRIFMRYRNRVRHQAPATVVHGGSLLSTLRAVCACIGLDFTARFGEVIQVILSAAGFIAYAVFALLPSRGIPGVMMVLLFYALCAMLLILAGRLKKTA